MSGRHIDTNVGFWKTATPMVGLSNVKCAQVRYNQSLHGESQGVPDSPRGLNFYVVLIVELMSELIGSSAFPLSVTVQ
jgi:hypothetical protein